MLLIDPILPEKLTEIIKDYDYVVLVTTETAGEIENVNGIFGVFPTLNYKIPLKFDIEKEG